MGPIHWNSSKSSLSNHNSQGIAMQSCGLSARVTGLYRDRAFSAEISPNSPFESRHDLTPGSLDVRTELQILMGLIRWWIRPIWRKVSLFGAVICRISRVAASFASEQAEEY
jgi:hypothetical protein